MCCGLPKVYVKEQLPLPSPVLHDHRDSALSFPSRVRMALQPRFLPQPPRIAGVLSYAEAWVSTLVTAATSSNVSGLTRQVPSMQASKENRQGFSLSSHVSPEMQTHRRWDVWVQRDCLRQQIIRNNRHGRPRKSPLKCLYSEPTCYTARHGKRSKGD